MVSIFRVAAKAILPMWDQCFARRVFSTGRLALWNRTSSAPSTSLPGGRSSSSRGCRKTTPLGWDTSRASKRFARLIESMTYFTLTTCHNGIQYISAYNTSICRCLNFTFFRLLEMNSSATLLLLNGTNSDSGKQTRPAAFDGISKFNTNGSILHHEMSDLRVVKTEMELEVLRYVARVSSAAHKHVMRHLRVMST